MQDVTINYFAETTHRKGGEPFGIRARDRRHHIYIIGKTGTGKTTLLRNLIIQDLEAGRGVGLIDPHGDLAQELLDYIPRHRTDEALYFNPGDLEYPVGFNLLADVPIDQRHLVASSVVSAIKNIWADSWGARLEYILYNAVAALLDYPGSTLLGVPRLLIDPRFRELVLRKVTDPMVAAFWAKEYPGYDKRFRSEAIAPVQNKVGKLLTNAPLRNIFGQVRGKLDPRSILNRRGIFIANLSKGTIGEEKAHLLGALLVATFQTAALGRAEVPEHQREDFFLHIDEFHNFTTEAFTTVLAEARKYRLCLSLAHQYIDQMTPEIRSAVFGNVGTLISFRVGNTDADVLARELHPVFSEEDLVSLGKYDLCLRLMIDGVSSRPFSARTLPPSSADYVGRGANIIAQSRRKYGRPRSIVEARLKRWFGVENP